jgi:hypothetical protein
VTGKNADVIWVGCENDPALAAAEVATTIASMVAATPVIPARRFSRAAEQAIEELA